MDKLDIYELHPVFKDYFSGYLNTQDADHYLIQIKQFYGDDENFKYYCFEDELLKIREGFPLAFNADEKLKAVILLFKSLIELFLDDRIKAKAYFSDLNHHVLTEIDPLFSAIYVVLNEYFDYRSPKVKLLKERIIISRKFDDFWHHVLFRNFNKPNTRKIKFNLVSSKEDTVFQRTLTETDFLFICGHGDDEIAHGGIQYYFDSDHFIRLTGPILSQYLSNVKVLGLLSCGVKPYANHLDLAEYFVLAEGTATPEYTETFVKAFILIYQNSGNVELGLKLGLVSLLFRSNKKLPFSVYHNKKLMKI